MQKVFLNDLPFGITYRYAYKVTYRHIVLKQNHRNVIPRKKKIFYIPPEFKTFIQTDINIPLVSSGFRVHKLNKNGLFVIQTTV